MKGVKEFCDKWDSIGKEQSGTTNVTVTRNSNVILGDKPSFASILHEESSKNKVNFCTLVTDDTNSANVLIPMSSVLEVHARFENTLYGYFLGKKLVFLVVERYLLNSWKKYGVLENGPWLIRNIPFILRKWTPSSMLIKVKLTSVPVWIKFHGVHVLAFTADGLSAIATRLGTPIMLDSCTTTTCMQSWGRMDYAQTLIDIRIDQALKDTMIILVPNLIGNGVTMHTSKVEYEWEPSRIDPEEETSTLVSNAFSALEDDNEKPMDDLVDDTQKKVEAPPRKTCIWSGRKVDSPKRNVVFSPKMKVHYFDRDDMEFDDMGHAVEEEENDNTYSENG
ncbi:zinc knuckle CX2CX4HX4C containing protein [Tanacetum coccineum]